MIEDSAQRCREAVARAVEALNELRAQEAAAAEDLYPPWDWPDDPDPDDEDVDVMEL